MKKKSNAKKWFGIAALVVVMAVIVVAVCVFNRLDMIVKAGLERYGTLATGTAVRVESVTIRLREGSGVIKGLTVANLKGFESPYAFIMSEIGLNVDVRSLTKEVKIINEILVSGAEIFADINAEGTVNLNVIKKNLDRITQARQPVASEKTVPGPEIKLIIRRIYFSDGAIHVRIASKGDETVMLKLPTIELTGLGEKNGATPERISKEIMGELCRRALVEVEKKAGNLAAKKLKDKANSMLQDATRKVGGFPR